MLLNYVIFTLAMLFINYSQQSQKFLQYFGDIDIRQFLLNTRLAPMKHSILILNNMQLDNHDSPNLANNKDSPLYLFLIENAIAHRYLNSPTTTQIIAQLPPPSLFNRQNVILVFDFQTFDLPQMTQLLQSLESIYLKCRNCQPLIALIPLPLHSIYQAASTSKLTDKRFQAVLISKDKIDKRTAVHIHPILNGCFQYSGIYMPKSVADFAKLKVHFRHCNLNLVTLNVSVSHWLPFCNLLRRPNEKVQFKFSMESELLKALTKRYNFTVNVIDGHDTWGMFINNEWTGMIKQVFTGTSDFALCGVTITSDRWRAVDFSRYIFNDELAYILKRPGLASNDWIIFRPFPITIWLPILASFVLVALSIYLTVPNAKSVIIQLFGVYINQSMHSTKTDQSVISRIIFSLWILASFILSNCYSSSFFSLLTIPEYSPTIESLADLERAARDDTYDIVTWNDSSYLSVFMLAQKENHLYSTIAEHMKRKKHKMITTETEQFEIIEKNPKVVLMSSRTYFHLKHGKRLYKSKPYVGKENVASFYTGIVFRKRSPLRRPFNVVVIQMQESGLFKYWTTSDEAEAGDRDDFDKGNVNVLSLTAVKSILFIWAFGIVLSVGCFAYELGLYLMLGKSGQVSLRAFLRRYAIYRKMIKD